MRVFGQLSLPTSWGLALQTRVAGVAVAEHACVRRLTLRTERCGDAHGPPSAPRRGETEARAVTSFTRARHSEVARGASDLGRPRAPCRPHGLKVTERVTPAGGWGLVTSRGGAQQHCGAAPAALPFLRSAQETPLGRGARAARGPDGRPRDTRPTHWQPPRPAPAAGGPVLLTLTRVPGAAPHKALRAVGLRGSCGNGEMRGCWARWGGWAGRRLLGAQCVNVKVGRAAVGRAGG